VVTADLPPDIQAQADRLRREHYPPERNQLAAHVTLFHALPPWCEEELRDALGAIARAHPRPPARLDGVMPLGTGTALRLVSPQLLDMRAELADRFHGMLTAQDNYPPRLHVTIQNKVSPREAKALQAALGATLEPRDFAFVGLAMHAYRGGPWELLKRSPFRG
jgi:2'-5' RNA ligase